MQFGKGIMLLNLHNQFDQKWIMLLSFQIQFSKGITQHHQTTLTTLYLNNTNNTHLNNTIEFEKNEVKKRIK